MTIEEMQKVVEIVGTADGGCTTCVENLVELLEAAFPAFEMYLGDYGWSAVLAEPAIKVHVREKA